MSDSSLRMSLFQRLASLQLWLLTRLIWYVAIVYLASLVCFALLRLFTGVSIKRIGYFSLRHVAFHPKQGVEIRIGKLGLLVNRPTVARPSIVSFVVSNLEVFVDAKELIESEQPDQDEIDDYDSGDGSLDTSGHNDRREKQERRRSSHESAYQSEVDSAKGIPLLPKSNGRLFRFIRWLVTTMRVIDVHLHSVNFMFAGFNNTVLTTINLRVDVRKTLNYKKSNFIGTLDSYQLSGNELPISAKLNIVDVYTAESLEDEAPWQVFEDLRLDINGVLNLDDMSAKEISIQMHSGRLQVDANQINDILNKVKDMRSSRAPNQNDTTESNKNRVLTAADQRRMEYVAELMLKLVNRVQITVGITQILRMPMACSAVEEMDNDEVVHFAMGMKDLNIDLGRFNSHNSGFKLQYDVDDIAHQMILTMSSFNLGIDKKDKQEEILYVPLVTNHSRTNIFSRTLKYLRSVRLGDEEVKNHSKVSSRFSIHTPTLSVEERHLPTLVRVALGLGDSKSHGQSQKSSNNNSTQVSVPGQGIMPNLKVELLISDLTSRIISENSECSKNFMFVANSGRILVNLQTQHSNKGDYKMTASLETLDDKFWYHNHSLHKLDIAFSESTLISVDASTLPQFQVKIKGKQRGFELIALRHEIFSSIGQLHASIRRPIRLWQSKRKAKTESSKEEKKPIHKGSVLREIPSWLVHFRFKAHNYRLALASGQFRGQANNILGVKFITKEFIINYDNKDQSSTDDRFLTFSSQNSILFKTDSTFYNYNSEDEELLSRYVVAKLPKLSLEACTVQDGKCNVEINIEQRLRIDLNINLILAFSVLKENIGKALLHHIKIDNEDESNSENEGDDSQSISVETHILSVKMPRALIKIDMPSDDRVMLELGSCLFNYEQRCNPKLHAKSLRFYSEHPLQRDAWCILASFIALDLELNSTNPTDENKVIVNVDGMWINVPYQFKLYRIIDNGITLAKAINTLILQTIKLDPMIVLEPKQIEGVPNVPRTLLKTKQLLISLEDDYFEADLTLIMLTQMMANLDSSHKVHLFENRIKQMLQMALDGIEERMQNENNHEGHESKKGNNESERVQEIEDNARSSENQVPSSKHSNGEHDYNASVADKVANSVENIKRGAHNILEHSHLNKSDSSNFKHTKNLNSSSNAKSKEDLKKDYHLRISQSLLNVSRDRINMLLEEEIDLGCSNDDGDKRFAKSHVWLDFWSSPDFSNFRSLKVLLDDKTAGKLSVLEAREFLLADISRMWIDTIRSQRRTQHKGVKSRRNQVVKDHLDENTCAEEKIVDYSQKPLVMAVDFRQLELIVDRTTHNTPEKLHKWLYELAKGQPKDSEFSILVPLYIDLKAHGGLKVELKDFPLPVLHFPPLARHQDPKSNLALQIKGDLVICEQLYDSEYSVRRLFVPLKSLPREKQKERGPDVIEVHRTLTPIKTVTDMKFFAGSTLPTQVCWCMAYKPGFHSVGEAFSGFSKPPIDPSPSLGFWDKIRLVLHARFDFQIPYSPLCLQMKAGKSPYGLLNNDSGFIFLWKNEVHVQINPDDDPQKLFLFESNNFELLVPNYLSWESDYIKASPAERAFPRKRQLEHLDKPEKVVFSFGKRTSWKLGMSFEKEGPSKSFENSNGKSKIELRDKDFRPHYDVNLSLPEFIDDIENYDAYDGFRSDYIHMAITVSTPHDDIKDCLSDGENFEEEDIANKCACYLTMGVYKHFMYWIDQFNSEQWPPIKTGSLFPETVRIRPSKKTFGTALSTATYQLNLNTLDLSFFEKLKNAKGQHSHDRYTGVKAKIKSFLFDWHTRREPPKSESESPDGENDVELSGNRRWRMQSFLAQVNLKSVQMRVIEALLRTHNSKAVLKALNSDDADSDYSNEDSESISTASTKFDKISFDRFNSDRSSHPHYSANSARPYGPTYVESTYWIDLDDFTELGKNSSNTNRFPEVKILPFLYTPEFCYVRRSDFSGKAVYRDAKTGNVFPKFGDMIVELDTEENYRHERSQGKLLETRLHQLQERISNFKESLESLENSECSKTIQQQQRIDELQELISIGLVNQAVLKKEMEKLSKKAEEEDARFEKIKKATKRDLENALNSESHGKKKDQPVQSNSEEESLETPNSPYDDVSTFINRYIIHAINLKWNNSIRNAIYRLHHSLTSDRELTYVRCRPAVRYLEELVSEAEAILEERIKDGQSFDSSQSRGFNRCKSLQSDDGSVEDETPPGQEDDHIKSDEEHCNESSSRLKTFFSDLKNVKDSEIAQKAHTIFLSSPRIQIIDEDNPSKCLQIISRDVVVQVIDTYSKGADMTSESSNIERRYGTMLNNTSFVVLSEEDVEQAGVEALCLEQYDDEHETAEKLWPPWIAIELCYNPKPLEQFIVIDDISFGIRYDEPNDLHVYQGDKEDGNKKTINGSKQGDADDLKRSNVANNNESVKSDKSSTRENQQGSSEGLSNLLPQNWTVNDDADGESDTDSDDGMTEHLKSVLCHHGHHKDNGKAIFSSLVLDAPKLVVKCDSVQFYTIYKIAIDFLSYRDPSLKKREEAINRVFLSNDFQENYRSGLNQIEHLQQDIRTILRLKELIDIRSSQGHSDHDSEVYMYRLEQESLKRQTRLLVLMRAFKASLRKNMNTGVEKLTKWSILADSTVMSLLDEQGSPMLELFLKRCHFSQLSSDDNGSMNRVTLRGLLARNLMPDCIYPNMLVNYEGSDVDYQHGSDGNSDAPHETIKMTWTLLDQVGGISILDEAEIWLKPMRIQVEHGFFDKMIDFAFPITDSKDNDQKDEDTDSDTDDSDDNESVSDSIHSTSDSLTKAKSGDSSAEEKKKKKRKPTLFDRFRKRSKSKNEKGDVEVMMQRASNYWSIRYLRVNPTHLNVSYQGKSIFNLLNIHDLTIAFPIFEVKNKTWTKLDLIMKIRKYAIKALLAQSGSIIGNKFKRHKIHSEDDDQFKQIECNDAPTSDLKSGLDEFKEEKKSSSTSIPGYAKSEAKEVEEDPKFILIPVHRLRAIENPDDCKEIIRQTLGTSENKTGEQNGVEKKRSSLQSERTVSMRKFAMESPGSPQNLRQNPQENRNGYDVKPNRRRFSLKLGSPKKDPDSSSISSSFTKKSSQFFKKIRRGFQSNSS